MTDEQKRINYREYTSLIVSLKLAAEFNRDKPNKAIKRTAKLVKERLTSNHVKTICDNAIKSMYPIGWLKQQDARINRDGQDAEDFWKVGAEI